MLNLKNKFLATGIVVVLGISGVIYGLHSYNLSLKADLSASVYETLIEVTEQQKFNFSSKITTDINTIKNLAFMTSSLLAEGAESEVAMSHLVKNSNFEYISIADMDGNALLSNGNTLNISKEEYFIEASKGKTAIHNPKQSKIRDAIVVPISAPIYKDGEIVGVMAGSYTTENLRDLFLPSFGGNSFVYVTDSAGNILVRPHNEYVLTHNDQSDLASGFESAEIEDGYEVQEEIEENLSNGEMGYTKIMVDGNSQFVCYSPSGVNDWNIFVIVPESYIASSAILMAGRATTFAIIASIVFIIFLLYVLMNQYKGKKERELHTQQLEKLAYYDEITGLPNLTKFKLEIEEILREYSDLNFVMAKLDIVNFKMINEIYGFVMGDRVVLSVAEHILRVQEANGLKIGSLTRVNADEFLLMDITNTDEEELIQRIAIFEENFNNDMNEILGNHRVEFRYSGYFIEKGEVDVTGAIEKTNIAHHIAKTQKNHRVCFYDDSFKKRIMDETEIENQMEAALLNNEFKVYLQPKYDLKSEKVVGAEALARWRKPDGKVILPNDFIPLFERNGFIVDLDMYMFERVCGIIRDWINEGKPLVTVSVNFSRAHLAIDDFVAQLEELANRYHVPKKYLEIELTESIILDNEDLLEELLNNLHNVGFALSMDDFGIGYSSLGLLKNLPVDVVKIDRSFFVNNRYKSRAKIVIESVMEMARKLQILTVAEGVEDKEHIDLLKEVGCDVVQGYYYDKPMPFEEFHNGTREFVQQANEPVIEQFDIHLLGNIEAGRNTLGSEMPVSVYRLFQFTIREALNHLYGDGESLEVFRMAGRMAGSSYAKEYLDLSVSFDEFVLQLQDSLLKSKIGVLEVEKINEDKSMMVLTVRDDLDCSGSENLAQTLCQYDEGFIAGLLFEYTKKAYIVREVDCWGTGADVCRFQVHLK